MFFSEKFQVSSDLIKDYGAVDISLVCDIPLFIDPMLIFNSKKKGLQRITQSNYPLFSFPLQKSRSRTITKRNQCLV